VIAVDTNILVYAHREDAAFHAVASLRVTELAEGRSPWAILWPCVHEFLAVVTHPRVYDPPTPLSLALEAVDAWLQAPTLLLLTEADGYWPQLRAIIAAGKVVGARVHDARVAALCRQHGVRELWSADRDFSRFPDVNVVNPLAG
jgi:uncharacterized protein